VGGGGRRRRLHDGPDWIERALVTVDVTGTWAGSAATAQGTRWFEFSLRQQGSRANGSVRGQGGVVGDA
jgi:hypothetical protein